MHLNMYVLFPHPFILIGHLFCIICCSHGFLSITIVRRLSLQKDIWRRWWQHRIIHYSFRWIRKSSIFHNWSYCHFSHNFDRNMKTLNKERMLKLKLQQLMEKMAGFKLGCCNLTPTYFYFRSFFGLCWNSNYLQEWLFELFVS